MSELEEKLSSVMSNPALMQQIMALAQNMEQKHAPAEEEKQEQQDEPFSLPDIDFSMIQKLSSFAKQSSIDRDQAALLHALRPYLSGNRVSRLERAMKAAKMAGFATSLLGR